MSRSHTEIGVLPFVVYTISFVLVTIRRALRQALDTQQLNEETEPFLPRVLYEKKMVGRHPILERDEATYHCVCSTLLDLLVDW